MRTAHERLAALVPAPRRTTPLGGTVRLGDSVRAAVLTPAEDLTAVTAALRLLPFEVRAAGGAESGARLVCVIDADTGGDPGSYRLAAEGEHVRFEAAGVAGIVNAVHTLRQLLPVDGYRSTPPPGMAWEIAACEINDTPAYGWRGALIDVARHFLPKHELLRHIDVLAAHKINIIQLHLTDDQGWRVESKAFPRLHKVGSWRTQTQISHFDDEDVFDGTPHGGYYTQDDLREIVRFAGQRGVTVVPEIELPGHCGALLAAYPQLGSPATGAREVLTNFGVNDALLHPGRDTLDFLERLLGETMDLFDSPWLHIGADESILDAWARDPDVLAEAARRGLSGPRQVFAAFVADVEQIVTARGHRLVTWDDGFATSDASSAAGANQVVMAWRGEEVARRAASAGHDVVLAPVIPTYFDYAQADDPNEPLAIGGPVTLADVQTWQPVTAAWSDSERAGVAGVQCQLWTEFIREPRQVDYMMYPRTCSFADVAWTGGGQDRTARLDALAAHLRRLDAAGVEYRPLDGPRPWQAGGTGRRAHRRSEPVTAVVEYLNAAAAAGETAYGGPRPTGPVG
ncbi:beta-N-acetylhexosaminidase [Micromonospora sp. NPDC000089]|uniref:beta-N-acetylhexosaminidase n=1 Tax=unclassified Micromonospora TaxID=2617518 RepID=UPI0036BAA06A